MLLAKLLITCSLRLPVPPAISGRVTVRIYHRRINNRLPGHEPALGFVLHPTDFVGDYALAGELGYHQLPALAK